MMDPTARVDQAVGRLGALGAPVGEAMNLSAFTRGFNLGKLWDFIQKALQVVKNHPIGRALWMLITVGGSVGSMVSMFEGIGDGAPKDAIDKAGEEQKEHLDKLCKGAEAAKSCAESAEQTMGSSCDAVEGIVDKVEALCLTLRGLKPGPECEAILQPILQASAAALQAILAQRNTALSCVAQQLQSDVEPAAQPGSCDTPVAKEAPPAPAPAAKPVDCLAPPPPVVEAAPVQPAQAAPAPVTPVTNTVVQPAQSAPPVECPPAPQTVVSAAQCPPMAPPAAVSSSITAAITGAVGATMAMSAPAPLPAPPCPPLITPEQVTQTINNGMNMAASAWQQCLSTTAELLCPPAPEPQPVVDNCPPPEPPEPPEPPVEQVDNAEDCPPPEPNDCEEVTPPAEPQEFDKSKHPSVPDGAMTMPAQDEVAPEPPVPAPAPAPAPEPNPTPAPVPEPPKQESWTPDIWVQASADMAFTASPAEPVNAAPPGVELASSEPMSSAPAATAHSSSGQVTLERSGQW